MKVYIRTVYLCSYCMFCVLLVFNSRPELKDLYNLITPQYAAHWKVIGTLLGIAQGNLNVIEHTFPTNFPWCCNKLMETWLERDTNASWEKIIQVINSPAVTTLTTANTTAAINFQQGNIINTVILLCIVNVV